MTNNITNKYFNDIALENFDYFERFPERRRKCIVTDKSYDVYDKREHFCEKLNIRAIVMPRVSGNDTPAIARSPMGAAMTQLIHSSMEQLERNRDMGLVRQISARLHKLPIYEMHMSTDLTKNPAFLRSFIEKEL